MIPPDPTHKISLTELQIKEAELRIKLNEEKKAGRFSLTVATPLLIAVLGVIASVLNAQYQRQTEIDLDAKRYRSTLLLKALGSKDQNAAAKMLIFMVNTKLLEDADGAIRKAAETPKSLPILIDMSTWEKEKPSGKQSPSGPNEG